MEESALKKETEKLFTALKQYLSPGGLRKVRRAVDFAVGAHRGTKRLSGDPYSTHPIRVARRLSELRLDEDAITAAILHDTLEDTSVNFRQLKKEFGKTVVELVESVTKLKTIRIKKGWFPFVKIDEKKLPEFEKQMETLKKMLLAMTKDIRVILIKLADKIHNLETLRFLPAEKRERIARETIEIYAPIADRLGIGQWKGLLEDKAFPYIMPDNFRSLREMAVGEIKEREIYLKKLAKKINNLLLKNKIEAEIDFRAKRWYSLHKKLKRYDGDLSKIYDLIALRIIVSSVEECYGVLGIIHGVWKPLIGRIKDYIALPKPNGYQSIHTTIFADEGKIAEIQIRTREMHSQCEFGVAAHWVYNRRGDSRLPTRAEIRWLKELSRVQKDLPSAKEVAELVKLDLFRDRIFVFTPQGDVKDLPEGSTPVDFAYSIHGDIGNRCAGAKIDGKMTTIDKKLENGQIVEIITSKKAKPAPPWLDFVRTQTARNQIRRQLRNRR